MPDEQRELFAFNIYGDSAPSPLARGSDPVESHLAAEGIAESIGQLQAWAVECVTQSPGKTAMELARIYCGDDPRRIGRRLGECVKRGLIAKGSSRECSITKRVAATWLPVK